MITAETLGLSVMVGDAVFLKNLRNESIIMVHSYKIERGKFFLKVNASPC